MNRSLKELLLKVLEGKARVGFPQFEALYTDAINERRYHDAVVSNFMMYVQYQGNDDSEALRALELLKTTIDFIVGNGGNPALSGEQMTPVLKGGPYCTLCGKSKDEVDVLLSGPKLFICDECVGMCVNSLRDHQTSRRSVKAKGTVKKLSSSKHQSKRLSTSQSRGKHRSISTRKS